MNITLRTARPNPRSGNHVLDKPQPSRDPHPRQPTYPGVLPGHRFVGTLPAARVSAVLTADTRVSACSPSRALAKSRAPWSSSGARRCSSCRCAIRPLRSPPPALTTAGARPSLARSCALARPCAQLMIPAEAAHDTIGALGDLGLMQFKDLSADKSAFQRTFASQVRIHTLVWVGGWGATPLRRADGWPRSGMSGRASAAAGGQGRTACAARGAQLPHTVCAAQIKRCDEMARQLRYFDDEVAKAGVPVGPAAPPGRMGGAGGAPVLEFDELESKLASLEGELVELTGNSDRLNRRCAPTRWGELRRDGRGDVWVGGICGSREWAREVLGGACRERAARRLQGACRGGALPMRSAGPFRRPLPCPPVPLIDPIHHHATHIPQPHTSHPPILPAQLPRAGGTAAGAGARRGVLRCRAHERRRRAPRAPSLPQRRCAPLADLWVYVYVGRWVG